MCKKLRFINAHFPLIIFPLKEVKKFLQTISTLERIFLISRTMLNLCHNHIPLSPRKIRSMRSTEALLCWNHLARSWVVYT